MVVAPEHLGFTHPVSGDMKRLKTLQEYDISKFFRDILRKPPVLLLKK